MGPRVYALYATNRRTPHRNSLSLSHSRSVDKTHHISNKNHHIKALFEKHTYFFQSIVKFSGGFPCLSSSVDHELTNTTCRQTNCTAICGDGLQVGNEACDDGKSTNASARGSDECTVECGFVCDAKESVGTVPSQPPIQPRQQFSCVYRNDLCKRLRPNTKSICGVKES